MRSILPVLTLILAACGTNGTDTADAQCDQITELQLPAPVAEVSGMWDSERGRLVLFGGDVGLPVDCQSRTNFSAQVWTWLPECEAFLELDTTGPNPRGRHAAGLTPDGSGFILHGGRFRTGTEGDYSNLDDAWHYDFATDSWTLLAANGPGGRVNHALGVFDGQAIVFGGNDSIDGAAYSPLADTWSLDLASNTWSEVTTTNTPSARLFPGYANNADALWVFGGTGSFFGPFTNDLHALDVSTGTWTELHDGSGAAPAPRFWGNLVHDPDGNRLLLWAGHDDTDLGNMNDLWAFDLGAQTWAPLEAGDVLTGAAAGFCDFPSDFVTPDLEAPERRSGGVAVWADDHLKIYGGEGDCGPLNDVWSWTDASRWTVESRSTNGEICQRTGASCSTLCF